MMTETNAGFTTQESAITVDLNVETPDAVIEVVTTQGPKGDKGTGVKNAFLNDEDCLVIQLDDGRGFVSEPLRGQQGPTGPMGLPGLKPEKYVDYWTPEDQKEIITEVKKDSASPIVHSASGSSLVLYNTADRPLRELKIYGKTMQVGMPSLNTPAELVSVGNDGSIEVEVCEKNLFSKYEYVTSMLFVDTANNAFIDAGDIRSVIIPITPNTTYTVSKSTATIMRVGTSVEYPDAGMTMTKFANHSVASNAPLTITSGDSDHWMLVQLFVNADVGTDYGSIDAHVESLMVEVGSVATEYEPHAGSNIIILVPNGISGIPVSSDGNYTDESGQQWLCDEIDLARGVCIRRVALFEIPFSASQWQKNTSSGIAEGLHVYQLNRSVTDNYYQNSKVCACSHAVYTSGWSKNDNNVYAGSHLTFTTSAYTSLDDWLEFVEAQSNAGTPIMVLYRLANPVETPLPAAVIAASKALRTYKPITNILNDSGASMQVQYISDTQIYVDTHTVPAPEVAEVGQFVRVKEIDSTGNLTKTETVDLYQLDIASGIKCSASGEIIVATDASDVSFRGLKLFGKTTQDGTPSPDAPVELVNVGDNGSIGVTVCGKNLLNSDFISSWFTSLPTNSTGSARQFTIAAGTYTVSVATNTGVFRSNVIAITLIDTNGNRVRAINGVDAGGTNALNDSVTFSLSDDEAKRVSGINVYYNAQADAARTDGEYLTEMQIEYGTEATEYEPYASGGTLTLSTPNGLPGIPVTSGGSYTDENGQQWVCDEVDFARGVYVQRVKKITFNGSESWVNGYVSDGKNNRFETLALNAYFDAVKPGDSYFTLCDRFANSLKKAIPEVNHFRIVRSSAEPDKSFLLFNPSTALIPLEDLTAWKTWLAANPIVVLLPLSTPIETVLTAEEIAAYAALRTHKPNTTVLNDSGAGMQLDYTADTKTYIDNKFAALAAAMIANA